MIELQVLSNEDIPLEITMPTEGGITPTGTKSITITENGTYTEDVTSYASAEIDVSVSGGAINNQNKTVNPSTVQQSVTADAGYTGLGTVTVTAMPSGTEGTPTATKGAVSNHSVSVTPSVTNVGGYIEGGTHNGTAVSVSASELVSGTKTISENGTGIDVTEYASVDVNVSGGGYTVDDIAERNISGNIVLSNSITSIPMYTFNACSSLTGASGNGVTQISEGAFKDCSNLETISFPNTATLGSEVFHGCSKLKRAYFPNVTAINGRWNSPTTGGYIFQNCTSLEEVTLKGGYWTNRTGVFKGCSALKKVSLPDLSALYGNEQFSGCSSLEGIVLPSFGTGNNANYQISQNWFLNCSAMKYCDLKAAYSIQVTAFSGCTTLDTLIIRNPNRTTTLANISAFTNTPFASGGTGGTLYVPNDLISSYQSATNWSTILGYTNNQIKSIESTHTDPNAPIDLTLYYADGTLIPT